MLKRICVLAVFSVLTLCPMEQKQSKFVAAVQELQKNIYEKCKNLKIEHNDFDKFNEKFLAKEISGKNAGKFLEKIIYYKAYYEEVLEKISPESKHTFLDACYSIQTKIAPDEFVDCLNTLLLLTKKYKNSFAEGLEYYRFCLEKGFSYNGKDKELIKCIAAENCLQQLLEIDKISSTHQAYELWGLKIKSIIPFCWKGFGMSQLCSLKATDLSEVSSSSPQPYFVWVENYMTLPSGTLVPLPSEKKMDEHKKIGLEFQHLLKALKYLKKSIDAKPALCTIL